ncbi:16S rRNA (guanine(527)-N(7))-methyltransferase RsmG [Nitrospira sp. M1]
MEHVKKIEDLLVNGVSHIGITLSDEAISKFIVYFHELCQWNTKVNLTSLSNESDIIVNLFVDSLAGSRAIDVDSEPSIADIGSGGGFPGIPLKIAFPQIALTLVEPKKKKTAFLHHIIGMLSLEGSLVKPNTIQEFVKNEALDCSYDVVVSKAISPEDIFPDVLSLLHRESHMCMYRSQSLGKANSYYGMDLDREVSYELPFGYGRRVVSILKPLSHDE